MPPNGRTSAPEFADKQRRAETVIHWTGKKAGLTEVLYSLDSLGVFDHGEISLRRIQELIEVHFDVKLGNIARAKGVPNMSKIQF